MASDDERLWWIQADDNSGLVTMTVVDVRRRTTAVGLGRERQWWPSDGERQWWASDAQRQWTENGSGELQMENNRGGHQTHNDSGRRTTVVSFRWRTAAVGLGRERQWWPSDGE